MKKRTLTLILLAFTVLKPSLGHSITDPQGAFRFVEIFCSETQTESNDYSFHIGEYEMYRRADPDYGGPGPMETLFEYRNFWGNWKSLAVSPVVESGRDKAVIRADDGAVVLDLANCHRVVDPKLFSPVRLRCDGTLQPTPELKRLRAGHYFCFVNE